MSLTSAVDDAVVADVEAIWEEFSSELLGFIRRRVRSPEIAEDILQDVMLRIHRKARAGELVGSVGAWVHQIARNAITDHYRSAPVRRELATGEEIGDGLPESDEDGTDLRAELSACVTPLLRRLDDRDREALTLVEVEGLTQADAAKRLEISVSGMKSRVQRARRRLEGVLVDCCEIDLDRRGGIADYRPRADKCSC